jgi:hypothetical protein
LFGRVKLAVKNLDIDVPEFGRLLFDAFVDRLIVAVLARGGEERHLESIRRPGASARGKRKSKRGRCRDERRPR